MRDLANSAVEKALARGATYADARVMDIRHRDVATKNGQVGRAVEAESLGIGLRVIAHGAWGFAATDRLGRKGIEACVAEAVAIAKASAMAKRHDVVLAPEASYVDTWQNPFIKDPFRIPIETQIAVLLRVDSEMRKVKGVTLAEGSMSFRKIDQLFVSSIGSVIHQIKMQSGAGIVATSFAGEHMLRVYELIEEVDLVGHAPRVAEECVALHSAEKCPEGQRTIILDSSQLGLQIHESIGHPTELDRVLGMEANFAGMSFLTLEKLNSLRYGSDIVNVVADARLAHGPGLGTFGYDDEGVPAQCTPIITNGLFTGYLTNRETAAAIGQSRSNGTMRTESWNRLPIIRMTNISILPGDHKFEDLIASTDDAIYMETNRSWSIDDRRYHFQFSTEIGWEIKNGKRTRMIKNPSYSGI